MKKLKVGDNVKVMDRGLLMLQAFMKQIGEDVKPNNIGIVSEITDNGDTILVEFPIGDDDPSEHSQIAPYPAHLVLLLEPNTKQKP